MKELINCYISLNNKCEQQRNDIISKIELKQEKIKKLEKQIKRLREKELTSYISWYDGLLIPLAKKISENINMYYKIYGPFGLRAETTIYFCEKENFDICKNYTYSITIIPVDLNNGKLNYDTGKEDNKFKQGTIGYMNGFNNLTAQLPESINDIIKLLTFSKKIEQSKRA